EMLKDIRGENVPEVRLYRPPEAHHSTSSRGAILKQSSAVTIEQLMTSTSRGNSLDISENLAGHRSMLDALPRFRGWSPCQCFLPPVCWQSYPSRMIRFAPNFAARAIAPAPLLP